MKISTTRFSTLTDEEFHSYLLNKKNPTDEDMEAALRLESLLGSYNALLEDIHRRAEAAICAAGNKGETLKKIRDMTAPAVAA